MQDVERSIRDCAAEAESRIELWARLIRQLGVRDMAELGVFRGDYAAEILERCPDIERYTMIDPWRHLDDWNKPANRKDHVLEKFMAESIAKTDFAAEKRVILRGKTTEVIDEIPDGALDICYIDGDHTLKGISVDLIRVYPKIRTGGWIGGDDFSATIWQHDPKFEPTLIFPFAVYFAEAVDERIYALPYSQFLIEKDPGRSFEFVDLTGAYGDISLGHQFAARDATRSD